MLRTRVRRYKSLRYQVRYRDGPDPETLIATDVADALRQARRRSYVAQSDVSLWREGLLIAECVVPADESETIMSDDLVERLVETGVYVMEHMPGGLMTRPKSRETENENQRTPDRQGEPPRPATEPRGAEGSSRSAQTATDGATGEPNKTPDKAQDNAQDKAQDKVGTP